MALLPTSVEQEHLAQADRLIAEAEEDLARQKALIKRLAAEGCNTATAEDLLRVLTESLELAYKHR